MTKKMIFLHDYKKFTKCFLLISLFFSFSTVFAHSIHLNWDVQSDKFTIKQEQKTIEQTLVSIEKNSDYVFIYGENTRNLLNKKVTLNTSDKNITEILDELFRDVNINYRISGRQIMLSRSAPRQPQTVKNTIQVTGNVTDAQGEPLIGVNVMIKGTTTGTTTNLDGAYTISVPDKNAVLEFTYVGHVTTTEKVDNRKIINVVLSENVGELEEIVVVGYGTQKKASVVGAIQSISPSDLQVSSRKNISNALAGKLAGVIAVTRSGEPGYDQSNFWIRGISSFAGNNSPLVLVDGIQRTLDDLNIAEIESFSILKDAAASAMYGVRGANGVILVNTKRGKVQKPEVSVRVEQAFTAPTKLPSYIGAADHMQLLNDLAEEAGKVPYYDQIAIDRTRSGYDPELYPDVDWLDVISKDYGQLTRADVNVNGGTEMLRYHLTGALYNEGGIMEKDKNLSYDTGTNITRYNLRANVDLDLTRTTSMRFSVGGYLQKLRKQAQSTDTTWGNAFDTPPMVHPAMYADGKIPVRNGRVNPWAYLTQYGYNVVSSSKIESLFTIEQKLNFLTEGLSTKINFSFDNYSSSTLKRTKDPTYYLPAVSRDDEGELILTQHSTGAEFLNYANEGAYGNNQTYFEWSVNYDRTFDKVHNVSALFLYNQRSYDDGGIQPYRNQGIAGRMSYSYMNKYVGEFNFGYNGSENFAKGQRFGFFPSVALGWVISEEDFWLPVKDKINFLKARVSWGKAGNDQIGSDRRFAYITTMNTGNTGYSWGNTGNYSQTGVTEGQIGVSNLTWETVTKRNLGLEIGLWDMFNIQLDIFDETRKDIFMQRRTIPTQSGILNTPFANFGKVENKGGEMAVSFNRKFGQVGLNLYANITYAKNKILEADELPGRIGTHQDRTGHSINELWGYKALGLYTDEDFNADGTLLSTLPQNELADVRPGDIKYLDWNDDGVINSKDEGYIGGTEDPRWVYGFGGGLNAYGFDFSFFFQGVGDTYRIIGGGSNYFIPGSGQGIQGNIFDNYNDRWTEENPSQDVFWPRLSYETNQNNYSASTWWKKDMSFLRLKQIELGYTLPKNVLPALKNTRIYINGNNLLTFSKFKLWDPELSTSTGSKYPSMKSIMLGVEIIF